jgi:hypothetical protein
MIYNISNNALWPQKATKINEDLLWNSSLILILQNPNTTKLWES